PGLLFLSLRCKPLKNSSRLEIPLRPVAEASPRKSGPAFPWLCKLIVCCCCLFGLAGRSFCRRIGGGPEPPALAGAPAGFVGRVVAAESAYVAHVAALESLSQLLCRLRIARADAGNEHHRHDEMGVKAAGLSTRDQQHSSGPGHAAGAVRGEREEQA